MGEREKEGREGGWEGEREGGSGKEGRKKWREGEGREGKRE